MPTNVIEYFFNCKKLYISYLQKCSTSMCLNLAGCLDANEEN